MTRLDIGDFHIKESVMKKGFHSDHKFIEKKTDNEINIKSRFSIAKSFYYSKLSSYCYSKRKNISFFFSNLTISLWGPPRLLFILRFFFRERYFAWKDLGYQKLQKFITSLEFFFPIVFLEWYEQLFVYILEWLFYLNWVENFLFVFCG